MGLGVESAIYRSRPWWPFAATFAAGAWLFGGNLDSHRQRQASNAEEISAEEAEAKSFSPRTLVVDFRDDVSDAYLESNGFNEEAVSEASRTDRLYRIRFATEEAMSNARTRLKADPFVQNVDFDVEARIPANEMLLATAPSLSGCDGSGSAVTGAGFPNDPCFAYQWHFNQIGVPKAWKQSQGQGVVVAVIDTGVSQVGDLAKTQFVPGYNFVDNNKDTSDDHGHGTHVAGTIAQSTNNGIGVSGVAFKASIMPLKVLSARGSGSMAAISQAIRWAADNGANVINMSLGGPFAVGSIHSAVKYARSKGVVVVAAAGNDGKGRVSYPGKYAEVIGVAATQFDEATAFYSNWGKTVDIAAPGGNVRLDQNGDGQPDGILQHSIVPGQTRKQDYLWFMGTSMAAPHVAGVAALVIAAGVTEPDAVEAILIGTARPAKNSTSVSADQRINDHYGAGIVDAANAVAQARQTRGAGSLAFAGTLALGITSTLRRRKRLAVHGKGRFLLGICFGSSGLFFMPSLLAAVNLNSPEVLAPIFQGVPSGLATWISHVFGSSSQGNPLLISAALPVLALGVGLGIRIVRPALAGFAIGVAGLLLCLVLTGYINVIWVPDMFDCAFLLANAAVAGCLGYLALVRE